VDGADGAAVELSPHTLLALVGADAAVTASVTQVVGAFASRGFRALGLASWTITAVGRVPDVAAPWTYVSVVPIFDPPRHDTVETVRRVRAQGVDVKMATGDQREIAIETCARLGMGNNVLPTESLTAAASGGDALGGRSLLDVIEGADGFAGVFPQSKYRIVEELQQAGHTVVMTGDGVDDAPALQRSHVGFAESGATAAARSVADAVLTSPGLSVLVDAITGSREILQRMFSYALYAVAITVRIIITFSALVYTWRFAMPSLVLLLVLLNDGGMLTISTDAVKRSTTPYQWLLVEVFVTGTLYSLYLAGSSLVFFHTLVSWDLWVDSFGLDTPWRVAGVVSDFNDPPVHSLVYLHTSLSGMALIFSSRAHGLWAASRPGLLLVVAVAAAQGATTFITVYADWGFTDVKGTGWGWAAVVWVYAAVLFVPIDLSKLVAGLFFGARADASGAGSCVARAWAGA